MYQYTKRIHTVFSLFVIMFGKNEELMFSLCNYFWWISIAQL